MARWEDPFDADDEPDDAGEEWKQGARTSAMSDTETVECFLGEIALERYDDNCHALPRLPEEPDARDLLTPKADTRRWRMHGRLLARWPRRCACGKEFRGPQSTTTRCAKCRRTSRRVRGGRR